jgi:hypothetical protein
VTDNAPCTHVKPAKVEPSSNSSFGINRLNRLIGMFIVGMIIGSFLALTMNLIEEHFLFAKEETKLEVERGNVNLKPQISLFLHE